MRLIHRLPLPMSSSGLLSLWSRRGWQEVIDDLSNMSQTWDIPPSVSAVGTGVWGLPFAFSGALPMLNHFVDWVKSRGVGAKAVIEVPPNTPQEVVKKIKGHTDAIIASSPFKFPSDFSPKFDTFFLDAPDPPEVFPHSDDFSLEIPSIPLEISSSSREVQEELSELSPAAQSVIAVVSRFVNELRNRGIMAYLRGSGGGSAVVCSLFGIPRHPRSLFKRFYPNRQAVPDVDIDVTQRKDALLALSDVCLQLGVRPYMLISSNAKTLAPGVVILPSDTPMLEVGHDAGISISPIPASMGEAGCKIDVLQSYSLMLLQRLGHSVQDMCRIAMAPARPPRALSVIPHLRTRIGSSIMRGFVERFVERGKNITVDDVMLSLALMRPGAYSYARSVLIAKYGETKAWKRLPDYHPQGVFFVYQEDLMRFLSSKIGWDEANRIRKILTKSSSSSLEEREETIAFLTRLGIDTRATSYAFCLSHAFLYALVCMYFIHMQNDHPREVFRHFLSLPPGSLSHADRETILREARAFGIFL